jgi:hypothetical protein
VIAAANTHTAVDNLLQRLTSMARVLRAAASEVGLRVPPIQLAKVHSSRPYEPSASYIRDFVATSCARIVNAERAGAVLIIGGTTNAVLKMGAELSDRRPWVNEPDGFTARALIVDEASMIVFPHFLALATLVARDGEIMVAGDHRQLDPIVAHEWESEDRPPAVLYQPFRSAYDVVRDIERNERVSRRSVCRSALQLTFRLPPLVVELVERLYRLDRIALEGLERGGAGDHRPARPGSSWETVWGGGHGLFLVVHGERRSRTSNLAEVEIIHRILDASEGVRDRSVAIITPHRAQRSVLRARLGDRREIDVIDTVERLQGGERPVIIVSGTASDPSAIAASVDFILGLNRSNVAFTRVQDRLIVICAESLIGHIPPEVEQYDETMLWKALRALCTRLVAESEVDGVPVRILCPPVD